MLKQITILVLNLIGIIIFLAWRATAGDVWAGMALGMVIGIVLITLGFMLSLAKDNITAKREANRFDANMRENMMLMAQMQQTQNQQDNQLLKQIAQQPVMEVEQKSDVIELDDSLFSEL